MQTKDLKKLCDEILGSSLNSEIDQVTLTEFQPEKQIEENKIVITISIVYRTKGKLSIILLMLLLILLFLLLNKEFGQFKKILDMAFLIYG